MSRTFAVASSWAASVARMGAGYRVTSLGPRPSELLELWAYEPCPFSRRVREAMNELDLDAMTYPCPRRGRRFRPEIRERGYRTFPVLRDPGRGVEMAESADIVAYLFAHYGQGVVPLRLRGPISVVSGVLASALRTGAGGFARPSRAPAQPLEYFGFEASPYCRIVREALGALELPHISRSLAKGSPGRAAFAERTGKMMVPYLVDPNTGVAMFESADIVDYLRTTYRA